MIEGYIEIDPVEASVPWADDPGFVYRDVHPSHRPVWHDDLWTCTCSRYSADRLLDMQRHADRMVKCDPKGDRR